MKGVCCYLVVVVRLLCLSVGIIVFLNVVVNVVGGVFLIVFRLLVREWVRVFDLMIWILWLISG